MKYALGLAAAVTLMLVAQIDRPAAETNIPQLSGQDKSVVIQAAIEAKTHQSTPKDFTPALGASVPRSLHQHAFKPDIAREVPALKHFFYAYTDREIVLIDGMARKVAAVIPLPAELTSNGQTDQGASEPAGEPNKEGATTGSVPAYTAPETLK
jgi:hypothetical protein